MSVTDPPRPAHPSLPGVCICDPSSYVVAVCNAHAELWCPENPHHPDAINGGSGTTHEPEEGT